MLPTVERAALFKFLATSCSLGVISTPNFEAAYRIFSVLNDRDLELAPVDILKAAILGDIRKLTDAATSGAYAQQWSRIERMLGRAGFSDLFGHIRTFYAKQKQRATLVKEFKDSVTEYATPTILIDEVIKPYAEVWNFIRNADFEASTHAETINEYLSWLNEVDFNGWVPPALVYFKRFRQRPELVAAFFKALERLTYFLLVTKAGVNERIETYATLTRETEASAFAGDPAKLMTLNLSDNQKRDFMSALDGDIYRRLPKARRALILRLEALSSDGSKQQTFKHISLEHVLPQTPAINSQWLKEFPDEDERDSWTHRLANLVPLHIRKNPSARNYEFTLKKDVYFKGKGIASPFVLTQEVRSEKVWTIEVLAARQERLVGVLTGHWELEQA
ncbi:HNH endonuclease family protein [Luteimonas sp. FCS-9]|uniref:DUF262 domain-containing protein n=1 Tax=Luteimonas sp. FCS-9 TaxID=1547516 RepID=UPI000B18D4BD|nr:HNH endonuclease family protein [Luteimonas sp. FCS-9]